MKRRSVHDTPTNEFQQMQLPKKKKVLQITQDFKKLAKILSDLEGEIDNDDKSPLNGTIDYIKRKIRAVEEANNDSVFITKQIVIQTKGLIKSLGLSNKYSKSLGIEIVSLAEKIGFKTHSY
jgi:hypothetical protein